MSATTNTELFNIQKFDLNSVKPLDRCTHLYFRCTQSYMLKIKHQIICFSPSPVRLFATPARNFVNSVPQSFLSRSHFTTRALKALHSARRANWHIVSERGGL